MHIRTRDPCCGLCGAAGCRHVILCGIARACGGDGARCTSLAARPISPFGSYLVGPCRWAVSVHAATRLKSRFHAISLSRASQVRRVRAPSPHTPAPSATACAAWVRFVVARDELAWARSLGDREGHAVPHITGHRAAWRPHRLTNSLPAAPQAAHIAPLLKKHPQRIALRAPFSEKHPQRTILSALSAPSSAHGALSLRAAWRRRRRRGWLAPSSELEPPPSKHHPQCTVLTAGWRRRRRRGCRATSSNIEVPPSEHRTRSPS